MPYRFPTDEAERLLLENFSEGAEIPGIEASIVWTAMREVTQGGVGGGRIYDTVIALSSFRAGAKILLTWNVRDFLPIAPAGLEIREP